MFLLLVFTTIPISDILNIKTIYTFAMEVFCHGARPNPAGRAIKGLNQNP